MANSELPQEILFKIFLLLPTKSVGRCRCLSKTWHTQLSTKHFVNSHLKSQQQKLIIVDSQSKSLRQEHKLIIVDAHFKSLRNRFSKQIKLESKSYLIDSCNGLILLQDDEFLLVSNPITRRQVKIPCSYSGARLFGFGYDPLSDDYKVFKISECYNPGERSPLAFIDVYYLKTSVWKRVVNPEGPFNLPSIDTDNFVMPFVNGAVHWPAHYCTDSVFMYRTVAFDLLKETFREIQLPTEVTKELKLYSLMVLKGCLSIVHRFDRYTTDVWMMKEYGDVDSWVKFRLNLIALGKGVMPMCFVGDEELLCFVEKDGRRCQVEDDERWKMLGRRCWVVHDLKGGTTRKITANRIPFSVPHRSNFCSFVESLVSPEQATVSS